MSVLVLLLAICTWTANAASTGASDGLLFRPDYTFDNEAGGWLKFHPIPLKWSQAALRCHHEGAILASPLNEGLSRALGAIMEVHGVTSSPVFTGTGAIYTTNEYQSMEGVPISDMCLTWAAEPPFTESTRYCIAMNANGTVTAVPCTDHHPFFCYRKKGVSVLNKCGTVDPEYVFNPKTGSCYKASKKKSYLGSGLYVLRYGWGALGGHQQSTKSPGFKRFEKKQIWKRPCAYWNSFLGPRMDYCTRSITRRGIQVNQTTREELKTAGTWLRMIRKPVFSTTWLATAPSILFVK